jgi:NAD(P)-dependent dehydrogenase (short-subunit alcohol dehydrogenase family)
MARMTGLLNQMLESRRAIITGGSQGLGYAIARAFLSYGADVLICSRTKLDLERAKSRLQDTFPKRRVEMEVADVTQASDVRRLFETAERCFGTYHIVVNNAGVHGPIGRLEESDIECWIRAIGINLFGVVHVCQYAVKHLKQAGYGKVINLSGGGATAPQFGLSAYAASKAGLVRFTETLALECADFGIDVNAVAPGALITRLTAELEESGPDAIGYSAHRRVVEIRAKGGSTLERAAELCVYLSSRESDGLSGRLISAVWDPWPFSSEQIKHIMASDIYTLRRIVPADRGVGWGQ